MAVLEYGNKKKTDLTPQEQAELEAGFSPARSRKSSFETAVDNRNPKDGEEARPIIAWDPAPKEDQRIEEDFMKGRLPKVDPEPREYADSEIVELPESEPEPRPRPDTAEEKPATKSRPDNFDEFEKRYTALRNQLAEDADGFNADAEDIDSDLMKGIREAKAMYQTSKDAEANKQLWEAMIQGISHIVAGVVGHQTGLNMGGLKFDKQDWDRRRDQLFGEMQSAKQDAYKKMSEDRQRLADKRASSYQNYKLQADDLDRARQMDKDRWLREQAEAEMDMRQAKALTDRIEAIKGGSNENSKQMLKDYNRVVGNVDQALAKFKEDNNKDNANDLKLQASEANKRAQALGLPAPYPDLTDIVKPGMLWGTNVAKFEDVTKRLMDHLGSSQDPQIAKFAQDNNLSYAAASQIIERRRAGR